MKFPLMTSLLAVITLVVAGCNTSQDLRYLDSRSAEKLEIPPDLTVTNLGSDMVLPNNFSSDIDSSKPLKSIPVLLKVDSLKLEGQADFYWLSVNEPVDNLFKLVRKFWSSEGFRLKVDEPAIGLMQTDWVYKKEGSEKPYTNFLVRLFSSEDLSATQNQFRTRIERDVEKGVSRIFISHRGTAYEHILRTRQNEDVKLNNWQLVPPNNGLEVEMLSRLMLFLGLEQTRVDQQLADIKFFSPLSSIHADYSENETYLLVNDVYTKTWYRTLYQLDRMNIEVVSSNIDSGLRTAGLIRVKTNVEEEVSEGGFLSFGSEVKIVKKEVVFVLTEESSAVTRISIQQPDGEVESSKEGVELLTLLHQFLK